MNQTKLIETLLTEIHRFIAASAEESGGGLGNADAALVIAYPPNVLLSDEEVDEFYDSCWRYQARVTNPGAEAAV